MRSYSGIAVTFGAAEAVQAAPTGEPSAWKEGRLEKDSLNPTQIHQQNPAGSLLMGLKQKL